MPMEYYRGMKDAFLLIKDVMRESKGNSRLYSDLEKLEVRIDEKYIRELKFYVTISSLRSLK